MIPVAIERGGESELLRSGEHRNELILLGHVTDPALDGGGQADAFDAPTAARSRCSPGKTPSAISSSVVLPAPFLPSTPMTLPAATFAVMSASTCRPSSASPTWRAAWSASIAMASRHGSSSHFFLSSFAVSASAQLQLLRGERQRFHLGFDLAQRGMASIWSARRMLFIVDARLRQELNRAALQGWS